MSKKSSKKDEGMENYKAWLKENKKLERKGFRKKKQIVPSGAKSANYSFRYVTGDLKVTRKKKGLFGRK